MEFLDIRACGDHLYVLQILSIVRKRSLRFSKTVLTKEPHIVSRFKSLQDVSNADLFLEKRILGFGKKHR